jgi:hypothetical protein
MKVDISYNSRKNAQKWQEVRIKIHNRDLWCGHVTLSHIIHPFLVKFLETEVRPPMSFYPVNIHEVEEGDAYDAMEQEAIAQWRTCLDAMIYAFYWIKTDSTFGPHGKEIHKELDEAVKTGVYQDRFEAWQPIFEKWDPQLKEHAEKIKEGTRLFGEHFQSFWT